MESNKGNHTPITGGWASRFWAHVVVGCLFGEPPGPLMKSLGMLGEAVIPLLMIILGMQLKWTIVLGNATGSLVTATLIQLVLSPFLGWGLTVVLGFTGLEEKVAILQTSTPAAVLPLLYALRIASRGFVLESGRVVLSGTGLELLSNQRVREAYLGL